MKSTIPPTCQVPNMNSCKSYYYSTVYFAFYCAQCYHQMILNSLCDEVTLWCTRSWKTCASMQGNWVASREICCSNPQFPGAAAYDGGEDVEVCIPQEQWDSPPKLHQATPKLSQARDPKPVRGNFVGFVSNDFKDHLKELTECLKKYYLRAAAPAADPGRIGKEAKQIGIKTLRCFAPWGFRPFSYVYSCEIYLIGLNFHL